MARAESNPKLVYEVESVRNTLEVRVRQTLTPARVQGFMDDGDYDVNVKAPK